MSLFPLLGRADRVDKSCSARRQATSGLSLRVFHPPSSPQVACYLVAMGLFTRRPRSRSAASSPSAPGRRACSPPLKGPRIAARGTPRPMAVAPAALHQMPRCTANSRASIVPGQFFFSPEVDAELPVVPGASTCDAAPATVAHIDQLRAASASMVAFYHNKDRQAPEEQPAAAGAS